MRITGVLLLLLALAPTPEAHADGLDLALKLKKYYGRGKYIAQSGKYLTNYNDCRARGATEEQCRALATFCAIQDAPLFGRYAGFFKSLGLNQAFKLDCGSQECFQCCYVPGEGCHTSFIGFPVINCNARYGEGTRAAGLTLITDPDAMPGEACISIPQTCEHIAVCAGPENFETIREAVDAGEDHPVNAPNAAENRGKFFASQVYQKWCEALDLFDTVVPRDPTVPGFDTVVDLQDFVTGRGCVGWRSRVGDAFPFDWSEEYFAIMDEEGALVPAASHRNGLCQLGALRILESVPALAERLSFIDSTVWPDPLRDAYLAQLADPDAAFSEHADPIVRDILACNTGVYDYRMLAVPLADEPEPGRVFNGCELGEAPRIDLSAEPMAPRAVQLTVEIDDPEVGTPDAAPVQLTVFWGDGRVDQLEAPSGQRSIDTTHTYADPGRYTVFTLAENTSGLRGFAGLVIESGPGEPGEAEGPVIVSEVRLVDAIARANTLSGNARRMFFQVDGHDADTGEHHRIGLSPDREIAFNTDTAMGTVVGHNTGAAALDFITLRPQWRDGFYTGFRKAFMHIAGLEMHIFDTTTGDSRVVELPLTPDTVRVFVHDREEPLTPEELVVDEMGRLELFLHDRDRLTERIEIDLPQDLLIAGAPGPVDGPEGDGQWYEERPGHFLPVLPPMEMGDPDMGLEGMEDAAMSDAAVSDSGVGAADMGEADMRDAGMEVLDMHVAADQGDGEPDGQQPEAGIGGSTGEADGGGGSCSTTSGRPGSMIWLLLLAASVSWRRRFC
ncbi:MAG: hypothetical protein ACE366_28345 [Bradymonadia bacterium]